MVRAEVGVVSVLLEILLSPPQISGRFLDWHVSSPRTPRNVLVNTNSEGNCSGCRRDANRQIEQPRPTQSQRAQPAAAGQRRATDDPGRAVQSRGAAVHHRGCAEGRCCREQGPLLRGTARRLELAQHKRTGRQGALAPDGPTPEMWASAHVEGVQMGKQAEGRSGAPRRPRRSFTPEFKAEVILGAPGRAIAASDLSRARPE
jgi:hypothetical protein